jgi:hypothetical protein
MFIINHVSVFDCHAYYIIFPVRKVAYHVDVSMYACNSGVDMYIHQLDRSYSPHFKM